MKESTYVYNIFNQQQWKALAWVPRASGTLSCIGSGTIIFMILRNFKQKIAHPRNRMCLLMSCVDIFSSMAWICSTAAAPVGSMHGAKGNKTTCNIQGSVLTLGTIVPSMNAMLSLYFLMVIRYKMKLPHFAKKYEKWMMFAATFNPLAIGIFGAVFEIYNPAVTICWIAAKCDATETGYKCYDNPAQYMIVHVVRIYALVLAFLCFAIIVGSSIGVWLAVRKPTINMSRYEFRARQGVRARNRRNSFGSVEEKETFTQALLFVIAYLVTWLPVAIIMTYTKEAIFELYLLVGIFTPLQGFWNFFIFIRPKFNDVRERNPEKNVFWVLKSTVLAQGSSTSALGVMASRTSSRRFVFSPPVECVIESRVISEPTSNVFDVELDSNQEIQISNANDSSHIAFLPHSKSPKSVLSKKKQNRRRIRDKRRYSLPKHFHESNDVLESTDLQHRKRRSFPTYLNRTSDVFASTDPVSWNVSLPMLIREMQDDILLSEHSSNRNINLRDDISLSEHCSRVSNIIPTI